MKARLHRVWGENVLVYGEFDITLDSDTVFQIIGKNGSGKSSLPVVIEEILYNNNSRGLKKHEIEHRYTGVKGWSGGVTFFVEEDEYTVTKVVKTSAKVKLIKNGEDISGHTATQTYSKIKGILGNTDFKTFTKLVYQSVESSMDFLTSTDANRKKFLVSLLGLDGYAAIEDALKSSRKEVNDSLKVAQGKVETVEKWLKRNSTIPDELPFVDVPELDSSIEEKLNEDSIALATAELTNRQVKEAQKRHSQFHKQQAQLEVLKEELETVLTQKPKEAEDVSDKILKVTGECAEINSQVTTQRNLYNKYKLEADKTECEACGSTLDVTQQIEARNRARDLHNSLKPTLLEKQEELKLLKEKQNDFKEFKAWERAMERCTQAVKNFQLPEAPAEESFDFIDTDELQAQILQAKAKLAKCKTDIENAQKHNTTALVENSRREEIIKQSMEYREQLAESEQELDALLLEFSDLDLLCKAFGSKGLISYKIESSVKVFEELINKYLSKFTSGQFALGFELNETKLMVVIYDDGVEVGMQSLSSGEKSKVNVSTLLAIRNLMSAISDLDINLLFLDEVISVLDDDSRDLLVDILLEETHLNTFLVSHGYSHPLTKDIRVTKKGKVSSIVYE